MGRVRDFVSSPADPAQVLAVTEPAEATPRGRTCRPAHERLFLGLETQRAQRYARSARAPCDRRRYDLPDGWDVAVRCWGVIGPRVPELTAFATQAAILKAVQQTAGEPPCTRLGLTMLRPPAPRRCAPVGESLKPGLSRALQPRKFSQILKPARLGDPSTSRAL